MRKMKRSLGYAITGLNHAFKHERNLRSFLWGYIVVLACGASLHLLTWEWLAIVFCGGIFLAVELLNTALERLTDVIDQNRKIEGGTTYHAGLKAAKDVAAAASLISLVMTIIVVCIVFVPYVSLEVKAYLHQ
jgi:diacylglycerol kinase